MTQRFPIVSIILPTYNEKGNIAGLIKEIETQVHVPKEIIVVDDNSPDGTADAAKSIKPSKDTMIRVIVRKSDRGLVNSLNEGIRAAHGQLIAWMDADFSHPPKVLNHLITAVTDNTCGAAIASRFVKGGKQKIKSKAESELGIFAGTVLNRFLSRIISSSVTDFTSGFIVIRSEIIKPYHLEGSYGEYFIKLVSYLTKNHIKVQEIGYQSPSRMYGVSKTAPTLSILLKHGIGYLKTAFDIWLHEK